MSERSSGNLSFYQELALRWQQGTITAEEKEMLEKWYNEEQDAPIDMRASFVESELIHEQRILQKIKEKIKDDRETERSAPFYIKFRWYAAAAVVLLLICSAYWLYDHAHIPAKTVARANSHTDIAPGHAGAVLHLSDGTTLVLDSLKNGEVAQQGNMKIVKVNGELKYVGKTNEVLYNTVVTDKGRQWKMILPDGTKVWLNAASSIHYPLSFTGKERVVEITGEAFFEVVHNAAQPFRVKAGNQVIEDIGTAFDVNAYSDEPVLKTTLVEGSVKIGNTMLRPGQQALGTDNNRITVRSVNVQDVTAWVNGQLSMENISLQELMRQLSRWYDVDVQYTGNIPDRRFGGLLDRNAYLSDIINVLDSYGIRVKMEGKKIIVSQP